MPTASGRTLHAIDRQHHGMELFRDQLFSTPVPGNKQEGVFQICSILDAFQGSLLSPESPCCHAVGFFHQHRCQGRELPKEVKVPHAEQQLFLHFVNTNMMWTVLPVQVSEARGERFHGHACGRSFTDPAGAGIYGLQQNRLVVLQCWQQVCVRLKPSLAFGHMQGQPADATRQGQQSVVFRTTHRVAFGERIKVCSCTYWCQALILRSMQLGQLNSEACCLQICGDHPVLGNWEVAESPGAALMSAACIGKCRRGCAWHHPACRCMGCLGSGRHSSAHSSGSPCRGGPLNAL